MNNILLVGCGNLGKIILDGLLLENKKVYLLEKNHNITEKINHKNCIIIKKIEDQILEKISIILLCVKPNQTKEILTKFNKKTKNKVFVSFIAGMQISSISSCLENKKQKIIRIMPNIFIQFNKSSSAIFSKNLTSNEKYKFEKIFSFFGYFVWLKNENDFDYFTAMFGGGPAYFLYIVSCFNEISKKNKIKEKDSINLLVKLLEGTCEILKKHPKNLDLFINKVTSKDKLASVVGHSNVGGKEGTKRWNRTLSVYEEMYDEKIPSSPRPKTRPLRTSPRPKIRPLGKS